MKDCMNCKNNNICKWIDEREKLKTRLEKISLKEGAPFKLECICESYIEKEEIISENKIEDEEVKEDVEEKEYIDDSEIL